MLTLVFSPEPTSFIASSTEVALPLELLELELPLLDAVVGPVNLLFDPSKACSTEPVDVEVDVDVELLLDEPLVTDGAADPSPSAVKAELVLVAGAWPSPSPDGVLEFEELFDELFAGVDGAAKLKAVDAPRNRYSWKSPDVVLDINALVNGTVAVKFDAEVLAALIVKLLVLTWKLSEVKSAQSPCGATHWAVPLDLSTAVSDLKKLEPRKSRTSMC